jgi:hypothetical protein
MAQRGQVLSPKSNGGGAESWAYRYRSGGRGSHRVQRGGFPSRLAAEQALERALQRLRQEQGLAETPTLNEFVDVYLARHDAEPETIAKLRGPAIRALESGLSSSAVCLEDAGHVNDHDVAVRREPGIGSQLPRADLEPQLRRRASVVHTALADMGRTLGEGSNEREDSGPRFSHTAVRAAPFQIEDVRAAVVDALSD